MAVRVALLDDDDRFRGRLVERLAFFESVDVVGQASSLKEFFGLLHALEEPPEVALLDIELPVGSGIDAASRLGEEFPEVGALMLTVFEDAQKIFQAVQAGASGYLLKDAEAEEVVRAILEVREGGAPLSRTVARRILGLVKGSGTSETAPTGPALSRSEHPPGKTLVERPRLSPREVELLQWIVSGEKEAAIAKQLFISPHTVRTHIKNIYKKLHVSSRAAVVRVTLEQGLLEG